MRCGRERGRTWEKPHEKRKLPARSDRCIVFKNLYINKEEPQPLNEPPPPFAIVSLKEQTIYDIMEKSASTSLAIFFTLLIMASFGKLYLSELMKFS